VRLAPKDSLLYVLAYLLWLASAAVCVAALIQLRSALTAPWAALGGSRYTVNLVSQVGLLLGGLAAFIYVVFLEGYYRASVRRRARPSESDDAAPARTPIARRIRIWLSGTGLHVLLRRFAVTIAIPLGVLILSLVLLEVALRAMP